MIKKPSLSTAELEGLINEFLDKHFSASEIDRLLEPVKESMPFQKAAEVLYAVLDRDCEELIEQLDRFTPHPACRYSLLRDVFAVRYYKQKTERTSLGLFSHAENVVGRQASQSMLRSPAFVQPTV